MKGNDMEMTFNSKRTLSIVPKFIAIQPKQSQNNKENDVGQVSSTKKYITGTDKQLEQPELDETEKFLVQTQNTMNSSVRQLQDFCRKKLFYKSTKQDLDYSVLSKQIKATKQKLKNKHQHKKSTTHTTSQSKVSDIRHKLKLLQKALSTQEMTLLEQQLIEKQTKIRKQYRDNPQMQQKLVRYFHNYQTISRFLEEVAKDTQKLQIKKQNIYLYYKMKEEMISLLSNEEFFTKHIKVIEESQLKREKALLVKTIYQQQRYVKIYTKNKHSYPTGEALMIERIEQLLETSKSSIKDAFAKFNRPDLMFEIELQFNKRLNQCNM